MGCLCSNVERYNCLVSKINFKEIIYNISERRKLKKEMKYVKLVAWILVIVGALNWGLIGFFTYNPILTLLGVGVTRIVYDLVGLSALVLIVFKVMKMKGMKSKKKK
jgi:uncharacterized protein